VAPTDDAVLASRRLLSDDGFNIGVLYRGDRKVYAPPIGQASLAPADLEKGFAL
jgi:2-oxoglutarate ferredoxin oxidoreductase subunit beta